MKKTINGKTTKQELIDAIKSWATQVKDESLSSRIAYTLKAVDKNEEIPRTTLFELAQDISKLFNPAPALTPVENSAKPKLTKKLAENVAKVENSDTEAEDEEVEPVAKTPKKTMKKSAKAPVKQESKPDKTVSKVETAEGLTKTTLPIAKIFPKVIEHEHLGKMVACSDKYTTIEEIKEAMENNVTIIFATYWTKRHIKEYAYGVTYEVPVPKSGFPHDLDTLQPIYACDGVKRIYALSTYTEAMFRFDADDLVPVECEANDGTKFQMRYSAGLEFEIYTVDEK